MGALRLVASIESLNGVMLLAWSGAFLVSVPDGKDDRIGRGGLAVLNLTAPPATASRPVLRYSGFFTAVEFAVEELIGHREPLHIQLMSLSVVVRAIDGERRIDTWSGVNVLADWS